MIRGRLNGRGFKSVGEAGQADSICLRPTGQPGVTQTFFAELKAPLARTRKKRLESQTEWAQGMRQKGFLCYQCPDLEPNPLEHFLAFYRAMFPGER